MPSTGGCPVRMPISPARVLANTIRALPDQTSPSGATSSPRTVTATCPLPAARPGSLLLQLRAPAPGVLDVADHVERLLRRAVELALGEGLERGHRVGQRHENARLAGELLGHEHRVGQEPLDPPRPPDDDLILLGQFVDTKDRDDVLEFP